MPEPIFDNETERKLYCVYNCITETPGYCRGYLEPGVMKYEEFPDYLADAYISGVILSNGVVPIAGLEEENMERIVSYDRAEKNDSYIGEVNMLTASSFTGTKGLIWGYDLAIDQRFPEGRLDKVTDIKQGESEVSVYDITPLLDSTRQLLGTNDQRHFIPMKGSHIVCATKSYTMTLEQAKSGGWVWCALSLAIATNRIMMSSLFMEDNGYLNANLTEEDVRNMLNKRVVTIAEAAVACGNDQHTTYKEIFVGWKATQVPADAVGCSLVCAPYLCIPQEANPSNKNSDLLEWTMDDWLVNCQLDSVNPPVQNYKTISGPAPVHF